MIHYLNAEQILFIHARLVQETGGENGIRDLGMLRSAVARPQATFDQADLYPEIFAKAAALFQSLVNNHPFVDGNKRTGITSTVLFLQINGYSFQTSQDEMVSFTLSVAQGAETIESISAWLSMYSK
jgi:death-on-curing protein